MSNPIGKFLRKLGARKRQDRYILDEFSPWFYLIFDTSESEEPISSTTCDIFVANIGADPRDINERILVVLNGDRERVVRFMLGLGADQFSDKARRLLESDQ